MINHFAIMASHIQGVLCVCVLYMLALVYIYIQDIHVTIVSSHAYSQALTNVILPVSAGPLNTA